MSSNASDLSERVATLDGDGALRLAREALDGGIAGQDLLHFALEGLRRVGENYKEGSCYLSGLVMGGWIMRSVVNLIQELSPIQTEGGENSGIIVLGTIEGDIHDLGKDLVGEVLQSHGFVVHDLGVDVACEQFLAQTIQLQPDLVAISIMINTCYPALAKAVSQLKTMIPAGFKRPGVMVGGRAVDRAVFDHVQADLWSQDILGVADQCRQWLAAHGRPPVSKPPPDLTG